MNFNDAVKKLSDNIVDNMVDVVGKPLAVGDKIVLIPQNGYTAALSVGVITGFTRLKVKIQLTDKCWNYSADTCLKFPEQVAKV